MYSEKYALYFIDECHEKNYEKLLEKFTQAKKYSDYDCAIYVVALPEIYQKINGETGQYPFVWVEAVKEIERIEYDEENDERYYVYDLEVLRKKEDGNTDYSDAYYSLSSSYQSIVNLCQELFGGSYQGFEIMDAVSNYSDSLYKVFMQLLKLRKSKKYSIEGLTINIE